MKGRLKISLNERVESVHEKKKGFQCRKCLRTFKQRFALNRHLKSVSCPSRKEVFQCNICQTYLVSQTALKRHKEQGSHNEWFIEKTAHIVRKINNCIVGVNLTAFFKFFGVYIKLENILKITIIWFQFDIGEDILLKFSRIKLGEARSIVLR